MFGPPSEKELANPRHYFDDGSPWGSFDNPYNFPNLKADFVPVKSPVPDRAMAGGGVSRAGVCARVIP